MPEQHKPAVFLDMDGTVIFSRASIGDTLPKGVRLRESEFKKGSPVAYMTDAAAAAMIALNEHATIIPVTTRSLRQFSRIHLPVPVPYAVVANGATILRDGHPDPEWEGKVASERSLLTVPKDALFETMRNAVEEHDGLWFDRILHIDENSFYLLAHKGFQIPEAVVEKVNEKAQGSGWVTSWQGRKLYAVPASITKAVGIEFFVKKLNPAFSVSAGDTNLDVPMFEVTDYHFPMSHGHIQGIDHLHGQSVVRAQGVLGGEELMFSLLRKCVPQTD